MSGVQILWEDEDLVVVDKPAGLIVHAAPGSTGPTLVDQLGDIPAGGSDPERPGIVHRLDRDTSGLLVVARSARAHAELGRMISDRAVSRSYTALVDGRPESRTGTIDAPLGRDHRSPELVVVGGRRPRPSITHFEVAEILPRETLLDVDLETGRTHQIRAHLLAIGVPIVGDPRYGGDTAGRYGLQRQFLHARRLVFDHPLGAGRIEVESPLPGDLAAALELARVP
jgi:23S rRNA pseudouridine1911/1915/1917 synthase